MVNRVEASICSEKLPSGVRDRNDTGEVCWFGGRKGDIRALRVNESCSRGDGLVQLVN